MHTPNTDADSSRHVHAKSVSNWKVIDFERLPRNIIQY
jgi:hypothetical protein